jgi:hypothetical protein
VSRNGLDDNGVYCKRDIWRPTIWGLYNNGMGGPDLHDQFNQYYRTQARTKKWPTRIYTHFLSCALTNAHILYKDHVKGAEHTTLLDYLDMFLDDVMTLKSGHERPNPRTEIVRPCQFRMQSRLNCADRLDDTQLHVPIRTPEHRQNCLVCKKRSYYMCFTCKIRICIDQHGGQGACWVKYHTMDAKSLAKE